MTNSNKCYFCGGDNDRPGESLCELCGWTVAGILTSSDAPKEITFERKLEYFANFKMWSNAMEFDHHPNRRLACSKALTNQKFGGIIIEVSNDFNVRLKWNKVSNNWNNPGYGYQMAGAVLWQNEALIVKNI